ncbi:hypothetical protein RDI58_005046 [Solanum bulbocastanum]|uniref:Uncharacterized protein n=1 Tax=Solanum bulbocastanum TaxID=147425 RepID=A0AAN8U2Q9_SOLBU
MEITGTIPPQLGNLSFLVSLDLRYNYFHGELPHELLHLRELREIDLSYNNFTGENRNSNRNNHSSKLEIVRHGIQ